MAEIKYSNITLKINLKLFRIKITVSGIDYTFYYVSKAKSINYYRNIIK